MSRKNLTTPQMQSCKTIAFRSIIAGQSTGLDAFNHCIPACKPNIANTNSPHNQSYQPHSGDLLANCGTVEKQGGPERHLTPISLKSFPSPQVQGADWILDVLEDLIAFTKENDLPASTSAISKAYFKAIAELQK